VTEVDLEREGDGEYLKGIFPDDTRKRIIPM
jgi:hypothetical protein